MRILVAAASRHGSTAEIAAHIATALRRASPSGSVVDVATAADLRDVTSYDALVLGSAVYMGRWLDEARSAAARITSSPPRPVWLFSSGPIGSPPKPTEAPAEVSDIATSVNAREHRVFAGRLDRHRLGIAEKAMVIALRVPDGDFRDWSEIDTWAGQIASELRQPVAG
ncbi:flavodoxin domain-containing protein [Micromonospora sp. NPDC049204]|uniref:flavodoxin domain-containing protein n=1 Tax=Micromonospora sp. NPDC049204 TaxID=3154351 RepID=UPI00340092DD